MSDFDFVGVTLSLIDTCDERQLLTAYDLIKSWRDYHGATKPFTVFENGELMGRTYPEMLLAVADRNHGIVEIRDAVQAIIASGINVNHRQLEAHIPSILARYKFKKLRPGLWMQTPETVSFREYAEGIRAARS